MEDAAARARGSASPDNDPPDLRTARNYLASDGLMEARRNLARVALKRATPIFTILSVIGARFRGLVFI